MMKELAGFFFLLLHNSANLDFTPFAEALAWPCKTKRGKKETKGASTQNSASPQSLVLSN